MQINLNVSEMNTIPKEEVKKKIKEKFFTQDRIEQMNSNDSYNSLIEIMKHWYPVLDKHDFSQLHKICERLFNQLKLDLNQGPKQTKKLIKEMSFIQLENPQEHEFRKLHSALSILLKEQQVLKIFEESHKCELEETIAMEDSYQTGVNYYLKCSEESFSTFAAYPAFQLDHPDSIALFMKLVSFVSKSADSDLAFDALIGVRESHRPLLERALDSDNSIVKAIARCGIKYLDYQKISVDFEIKHKKVILTLQELVLAHLPFEEKIMRELTPAYTTLITMYYSFHFFNKKLLRETTDLVKLKQNLKKPYEIKTKCFALINEKIQGQQEIYARLHTILLDSINRAHLGKQGSLKRAYLKGIITPIEINESKPSKLKPFSAPKIIDILEDKKKNKKKTEPTVNANKGMVCVKIGSQELLESELTDKKIENSMSIISEIEAEPLFKPYLPYQSYSSISYTWHVRRWLTPYAAELPLPSHIFPEYVNLDIDYQQKMVIKHGFSRLIDPLIFDRKYAYDFGQQKCLITLIQYPDNKIETGTISFVFNKEGQCIHRFHNIKSGPFSQETFSQYYEILLEETKQTWEEQQADFKSEHHLDEEVFIVVGDCLLVHQLHGYAQLEDNKNKIKIIVLARNEQLNSLILNHRE